jgi:rubrerythrin
MLTDEHFIAAGRAIQPVLLQLLDPAAARSLDAKLTDLLDLADTNPTAAADAIETAIGVHRTTQLWFDAYIEQVESGERTLSMLPGRSTTPPEFKLYVCEECGELWLRESPNQTVPNCPNHGDRQFVPYTPPKTQS